MAGMDLEVEDELELIGGVVEDQTKALDSVFDREGLLIEEAQRTASVE